jgi:hypothetical protein
MPAPNVTLWRLTWARDLGVFWMSMKSCDAESAPYWAARLAARDAQGVVYKASPRRPALPDNAQTLARHPAVFA